MNRTLLLLLLSLFATAPVFAQSAKAKLYAKAEGDDILVAIQIQPDLGCWVYDQGEDVGGMPTVVTLGGIEGADWTEVWFPEPKVKTDEFVGTSRIFDKKTVAYAAARGAAAGADPVDVTARVTGQACNTRLCVSFEYDLERRSAGTDDLWSGFPAALLTGPPDGGDAAEDDAAGDSIDWEPLFGDERAVARAFARETGDDEVELVVQVATTEGWHMYHGPTEVEMGPGLGAPTTIEVEGGNADWLEVQHPRPYEYVQDASDSDGWLWAYEGVFLFGVEGELYDDFDASDLTITVRGQACDPTTCVPVEIGDVEVVGEGPKALYAAAFAEWELPERGAQEPAPAAVETAEEPGKVYGQRTDSKGLLGFVLLAIGAGLFTLLMPCTYPMIPITISFFTKQAEQREGSVLPFALLYGLGIVAMFVAIGVLAGPVIVPFAQHEITNFVIGALFVVFALVLFGVIDLQPPRFLMNAAGKASNTGGYVGVFLMGLTLVVTSFTCTAPFVGSLLAAGASGSDGGTMRIVIGMAAFGFTMAVPFVFLALVPGKLSAIPSAGGWMNTVKVFMGFVELGASLKFFSNADIALQAGWITREVFLAMWAGIAFVTASYLFGRINLKGENPDGAIGPLRMLVGVGTVLFGFYCFLGVQGYQLDRYFMNAMAPPPHYTRGLVESHRSAPSGVAESLPEFAERQGGSIVVVDDYDAALGLALDRGEGLLVNFTGHT
ncbi:MAG: cytochrome c biogenesis protein CcdA [Planctomycetota bacterium]